MDFRETIRDRAQKEPKFRKALLREAIELMLSGDEKTRRAILRNYINATVGFRQLAEATSLPADSLIRMFGPNGNPSAKNLFGVLVHIQAQRAFTSGFALVGAQARQGVNFAIFALARAEARRIGPDPSPPSAHTLTVQCIVQQLFDVRLIGQSLALGELPRQRKVRSREADRNRLHHRAIHHAADPVRPAALFGNIAQVDILIANCVESRQLF